MKEYPNFPKSATGRWIHKCSTSAPVGINLRPPRKKMVRNRTISHSSDPVSIYSTCVIRAPGDA